MDKSMVFCFFLTDGVLATDTLDVDFEQYIQNTCSSRT